MEQLVNGLINFVIGVLNILLDPINSLINTYIPDLSSLIQNMDSYFALINDTFIPWIKDLFLIPQWCYTLVVAFIVYRIIAPLATNTFKLVMKYWETLV